MKHVDAEHFEQNSKTAEKINIEYEALYNRNLNYLCLKINRWIYGGFMLDNVLALVPDNGAEADAEDVSDDNVLSPLTS